MAITACEQELQNDPNNGAKWHYLARAYGAGLTTQSLDAQVYGDKAIAAMKNAARLGEPNSFIRVAANGGWDGGHIDENVHGLRKNLAELQVATGASPNHALAYATGRGMLLSITERVDGEPVLSGTHDPEMINLINAAAAKIGWKAVYDYYFELMLTGDCFFKAMCMDYFATIKGSKDARAFVALAVDNLTYAYRNTNRAFAMAGSSESARQKALRVGDRSLDSARAFADLAAQYGNAEERAAAEEVMTASREFSNYRTARYGTEGEQAARAEAEGWTSLAALIGTAIAISANSPGNSVASHDEPADWVAEQRARDCDAARGMMAHRSTMSQNELDGFASMEMASCY